MHSYSDIPGKEHHGSIEILSNVYTRVSALVLPLKADYAQLWHTSFRYPMKLCEQFTPEQQMNKEDELDRVIGQASSAISKNGTGPDAIRYHRLKNTVRNSLFNSMGLFDCIFDEQTRDKFSQSTDDFIREAKEFNPAIRSEDIYQALRNVWIINSIQLYLGYPIVMTPSCFAYSMLYPYTDNALDAPDTGNESKSILNHHFTLRLAGLSVPTTSTLERDVFRLFEFIENEYDRSMYPHVYDSLLAIQYAQTRSVKQQDAESAPDFEELLDISIEKGGTSVLADGFLVSGNLSPEDAKFLFGYGVFLQIIDDLQDLRDDLKNNQMTLIGRTAGNEYLDEITNRILAFTQSTLTLTNRPHFHDQGGLGELIERSCRVLVLEAIAQNHMYYTPQYVSTMEKYSPVRFEYFRRMKDYLRKLGKKLPGRQSIPPNVRLGESGLTRVYPDFIEI
jgi:hypothetical protein